VGAAGEISLLEPKVAEHSLDDGDVLRLPTVGRARYRELLLTPPERVEAAGAKEWKDLERFGAGAPIGERVRVTGGAKQLVAIPDHRGVHSMFRLGSFPAGDCNIDFVRLDHIPR
jgi:hypothetical protein